MGNQNGRRQKRDPLPGDPSDPVGLTALLERFLLWMETHHYAQTVGATSITLMARRNFTTSSKMRMNGRTLRAPKSTPDKRRRSIKGCHRFS